MKKPNLVYTIALDRPGQRYQAILAKLLVSSLLRTHFSGSIYIFRNTPEPLYLVERARLTEHYLDIPDIETGSDAWPWKYRAASHIESDAFDRIMFLDADSLALRNVDHLLEGDWDIQYQPESGKRINNPQFNSFLTDDECKAANCDGVNSGSLAVRGEHFPTVMREWALIDSSRPCETPQKFRGQVSVLA